MSIARRSGQIIVGAVDTSRTLHRPAGIAAKRRGDADATDVRTGVGAAYAPDTIDSRPAQCGERNSRLSTLPAPDFGSGSLRNSIAFGAL